MCTHLKTGFLRRSFEQSCGGVTEPARAEHVSALRGRCMLCMFFPPSVSAFTHVVFDRVVHDDVISPHRQPGAKRDDVAVPKRTRTLPCEHTGSEIKNQTALLHFVCVSAAIPSPKWCPVNGLCLHTGEWDIHE